jgi:hypothetical protein
MKPEESARKEGWTPGAAVGANFDFTHNRSVVGQADGASVTLGLTLAGVLEFNRGPHEWRNTADIGAGVSRTPSVEEWVKTRDDLEAETIYLYHVVPAFGPFARVAVSSTMFAGFDVRAAAVDYVVQNVDGSTSAFTGRRLRLTDPFQPLTLKESLGVFAHPVTTERIRVELRAGPGAQQVFAAGALALDDDEATPIIEVKELDSYQQLGAEGVANAWGHIDEAKRIAYTAGISVLVPLLYSDLPEGDDRGALELTNIELSAGLSVKIVEWASLDYKLAVVRQPQLIDATQVTNNVLLTLGTAFGSKAPAPPAPPPCAPCDEPPPAPAPAPAAAPAEPAPATPPAPEPAPAPPQPEPAPPPPPPPADAPQPGAP